MNDFEFEQTVSEFSKKFKLQNDEVLRNAVKAFNDSKAPRKGDKYFLGIYTRLFSKSKGKGKAVSTITSLNASPMFKQNYIDYQRVE